MTVYGMNHVALKMAGVEPAKRFYAEVLGLELQRGGQGQAFFKVGEHQFLALSHLDHHGAKACCCARGGA